MVGLPEFLKQKAMQLLYVLTGGSPLPRCTATGRSHDYPDSIEGEPWHMVKLTCKYCEEKFYI